MEQIAPGMLERHDARTRVLHWAVAIFFVLALATGMAIYSPWLFRWVAPLFGGGPTTRLLHPWFSLAFTVAFALQLVNWLEPMRWTAADRRWMTRIGEYVRGGSKRESDEVGFFNGGQKVYFWVIVACAAVFLVSGVPMWFPRTFGRVAVDVGYVVHDVAGLLMLSGFIVHVYEATAAQPGTFRAMTRGTVSRRWASTHHPAWYRAALRRQEEEKHGGSLL